ncbi:hypothetical protein KY358_04840 [Candidatus Woesearchaeota archaeon]|nr:hypothetical protein [Candidatus Woesearchaeota archaeon]
MASEIISEKPISMGSLKQELEKIKKRDKELGFRAARTQEYLEHFEIIKNSDEIYKKIEALNIPRLKDQHIVKILDIQPKTLDELKAIIQGYTITVNNENLKKIVEVINSGK